MRELALDEYTAAVARHVGREPDERLRAACEIAQDKAQTLAEVWPLIRFALRAPGRGRDGLGQGDEGGRPAAARGRAREALGRARVRRRRDRGGARAAAGALGVKPGKLYQPIRVAITGTTVSPGIFESLAAARARGVARADRPPPAPGCSRTDNRRRLRPNGQAGELIRNFVEVPAKPNVLGCRWLGE